MKAIHEAVICVYKENELVAVVRKTGIIEWFKTEKMTVSNLAELLDAQIVSPIHPRIGKLEKDSVPAL